MNAQKVVVHFADGRVVKGHTDDFEPTRPRFRLVPVGAEPHTPAIEVVVRDLKAVFFVRTFGGDPQYRERKEFAIGESPPGLKVEVTFEDNEGLVGYTTVRDARERPGFFVTPVDPRSNNQRVFVVTAAVESLRYL